MSATEPDGPRSQGKHIGIWPRSIGNLMMRKVHLSYGSGTVGRPFGATVRLCPAMLPALVCRPVMSILPVLNPARLYLPWKDFYEVPSLRTKAQSSLTCSYPPAWLSGSSMIAALPPNGLKLLP